MTADEELTEACWHALGMGPMSEHLRLAAAMQWLVAAGWEQWWPAGAAHRFPAHRLRRRDTESSSVTVMQSVSATYLRGLLREMHRREVCPRCGSLRPRR
jgi:hypothetical protein